MTMTRELPKIIHLDEIPSIPGGRRGRRDAGLAAIGRALELRPEIAEWAQGDEDLDSLHDDPEFRAMLDR